MIPFLAHRQKAASSSIVSLTLAITPLLLMLAAVTTSAHAQTTSSPADWTQFLRDNMQRWNPYETVLGVNNAGSLQLKWKKPLGSHASPLSSPAVVNGVAYFGSADHNAYALNATTGALLWSFLTGGSVNSSPAVLNGVVYIGSEDHNVYALNARTGAKVWSFNTGQAGITSPAIANGVVYVGAERDDTNNNFFALNATTGALLWSGSGVGPPTVFSSPAVANGVVYVAAGVAAPIAYHERTAGGAQRRIPCLVAVLKKRREAGRHLV